MANNVQGKVSLNFEAFSALVHQAESGEKAAPGVGVGKKGGAEPTVSLVNGRLTLTQPGGTKESQTNADNVALRRKLYDAVSKLGVSDQFLSSVREKLGIRDDAGVKGNKKGNKGGAVDAGKPLALRDVIDIAHAISSGVFGSGDRQKSVFKSQLCEKNTFETSVGEFSVMAFNDCESIKDDEAMNKEAPKNKSKVKLIEDLETSRTQGNTEQRSAQRFNIFKDNLLSYIETIVTKVKPTTDVKFLTHLKACHEQLKSKNGKQPDLATFFKILPSDGNGIGITAFADRFRNAMGSLKLQGKDVCFYEDDEVVKSFRELMASGKNEGKSEDDLIRELSGIFNGHRFEVYDGENSVGSNKDYQFGPKEIREILYKVLMDTVETCAKSVLSRYQPQLQDRMSWVAHAGGLFKSEATYSFKMDFSDGKGAESEVASTFKPAPMQVPGKDRLPVANLGISTLEAKQGGTQKTLVSFVRFGQMGVGQELEDNLRLDEEQRKDADALREEASTYHYLKIAELMLQNDETKLKGPDTNSPVEVPIFRIDMCGDGESEMTVPNKIEGEVTITKSDGQSENRQVTSKVYYFHVPIDAKGSGEDGFAPVDKDRLKRTNTDLNLLLGNAKVVLNDSEIGNEEDKRKIKSLVTALEEFQKDVLYPMLASEEPTRAGKDAAFLRFGSQVAMLVSLLGNKPAINCNCGRDRTGAMDSEIKFLACRLERGEEATAPVDKRERTSFLNKTGNNDMAFAMNGDTNGINVHQNESTAFRDLYVVNKDKNYTV